MFFDVLGYENSQSSIKINLDLLETNIINIFILIIILIYLGRKFLGNILINRQNRVITSIRESEERLEKSTIRLNEAKNQLSSAQIIINQIKQEAKNTAANVKESILKQGKTDIERLLLNTKNYIYNTELQIKKQIKQQIAALALQKVQSKLKDELDNNIQQKIIDQSLAMLTIRNK
jgi:F-type H+-transporting ATPase subunit b|uniref:ATP synthase subunit b, chloroplastic n=2 Tax=Galdieria TaxID=83373 RepID=ATPF_GALSU|nr:RecName: Full=ATP synthase subunit b, chloroplastic; AltName: Full=ATP synthase F(0) sector subunit b; AltName: Full=ATPase subunit I [Galdieria sulphuraria]pir/S39518/ H+-transporting two-sector ATPase (EC 3.6.3.14) chain b - red alga (Cyanidium caldarium) chloroplast [Cyanidium caldarium]WDA99451.1 ATP synthase CF0 B chain [Galdieria yellowstonensis]CAA48023.1 H(+)-transporting ATP synthase [Galdieria sulphuraria]